MGSKHDLLKKRIDHLDQTLLKLQLVQERLLSLPPSASREELIAHNKAAIRILEKTRIDAVVDDARPGP